MDNPTLWRRWIFATATCLLCGPALQAQVIVNEDGIYDLTADTTITLDGKPLERRFLDLEARGYRARYIVEGNLQSGLNRGVLKSIELETRLRGPVTSTDPLKVLEQAVVVTDDTVLVDVPGDDLANVQTGDILEVSGLAREDGSTEATMLRLRTDTDEDDEWKVEGFAADASEFGFFLGDLQVQVDTETLFEDCGEALQEGQYVQVEALPVPGYLSGDPITADTVECDDEDDLDGPPGSVIPAEIEGIITEIIDPETFRIGSQVIALNAETEFENGTLDSLQVGIRAEVEGLLDVDTDVLLAEEIEFHDDLEIEISAPVDPSDIIPGATITILGLEFEFASDIEDEDGIALTGLSTPRQIELEGVILPNGVLLATDISDDGSPRDFDISLEGLVENVSSPTFKILGITVDASAADFELDKSLDDECDDNSEGSNDDDNCDDEGGDDSCDDNSEGSNDDDDCDDEGGDDSCDDNSEGSNDDDDCDDEGGDDSCDDNSEGSNDDDNCDDEGGDDSCDDNSEGSNDDDDCDDEGGDDSCDDNSEGSNDDDDCDDEGGDDSCDDNSEGSNDDDDCDDEGGDDSCDDNSEGSNDDDCDDEGGDDSCDDNSEGSNDDDDCDDEGGDDSCDDNSEGSNDDDDCDDEGGDDSCDDNSEGGSDDCDDEGTSLEAFFANLQVGDRVSVEGATFDAATNTLFAGEVELEESDDDDDSPKTLGGAKGDANNALGVGLGTITGSDRVFANAFE